jgi:hypothetical protein
VVPSVIIGNQRVGIPQPVGGISMGYMDAMADKYVPV